jgi:hypothetical protein
VRIVKLRTASQKVQSGPMQIAAGFKLQPVDRCRAW